MADPNQLNPFMMGDPEAESAAAASQAMAPIVGPYLRDVVTGQHAKNALMEMFPPTPPFDPNRSIVEQARERLRGKSDLHTAMDLAMSFSGGGLSLGRTKGPVPTLWHGASRELEGGRFDPKKLLSGEGVHAEGHGGYVSEARKVAEWYRDTYGEFTPEQITIAKKVISDELGGVSQKELEHYMGQYGLNPGEPSHWIEMAHDFATHVGSKYERPTGGALYEMKYPGARIEEFMRWDQPLEAQSEYVKKQLKRLGIDENKLPPHDWTLRDQKTGRDLPFGAFKGDDIYSFLGSKYGTWTKDPTMNPSGDPATAAVMRLNGIRGIRYPASEINYRPGSVFNYSVFNPEALEVIKKYGMAGLMAGGGATAALNVGEAQAAAPRWGGGFQLHAVDHDPFSPSGEQSGIRLIPVDHDPFAEPSK